MQIFPINYSNTNSYKISAAAGKSSTANVFANNLQPIKKDSVSFSGHKLKRLNFITRPRLREEVIDSLKSHNLYKPRERIVGDLYSGSMESMRTDYHLQLAQYLLNHEVIKVLDADLGSNDEFVLNINFKNDFNTLLRRATSYVNREEYGARIINRRKTKANAEAMMDFADFIVKLPIYNHKFVKALLFDIIASVDADNIDQRKFMAEYVTKHPETLISEWYVHENLVLNDGYLRYKEIGCACGAYINEGEAFFETDDFKQSTFYQSYGTPNFDNENDKEKPEELSIDFILNRVSSTKFKGLSQEEAEYLAKIVGEGNPYDLMKLNDGSIESKKLYRQLIAKYHPDKPDKNADDEKISQIIIALKNYSTK